MLELRNLNLTILKDGDDFDLIHKVTLHVNPGHFMAIVGPSGCGKTTLLKLIAGISEASDGDIFWQGRNLAEEGDLEPAEIGYVPQFSIAYDHLTVEESIEGAVRLRVKTPSRAATFALADRVIEQTGLDSIRDNMVKVLSGGQKRRLGLAIELVSNPHLLLCDEVTSGLDPKSEREIVHLLHWLSQADDKRIVINVTHSLSNLELYDSVLVLHQGRVAYHGPPRALNHYFSVDSAEDVYPMLAKRPASRWFSSWDKHRDAYYKSFGMDLQSGDSPAEPASHPDPSESTIDRAADFSDTLHDERIPRREEEVPPPPGPPPHPDDIDPHAHLPAIPDNLPDPSEESAPEPEASADPQAGHPTLGELAHGHTPGLISQFTVLLSRRWRIFFRDRVQLVLHLAMMLGFPILVWIFAKDGIGPVDQLDQRVGTNIIQDQEAQFRNAQTMLKNGSLISGIVMFQVVLLTLMGANNSAREIASERLILEKEKLGGVRPAAYLLSKIAFLTVLAGTQALWMAAFVDFASGWVLPGSFSSRLALLLMVNFAITAVCLGISSLMRSPEQSTLLSIYLVGFQLPLSGAVLALPDTIDSIVHPFIAAFWSWSGSLKSMEDSSYYKAIQYVTPENYIIEPSTCAFILGIHILVGLLIAYFGCKRSRWD